MPSEKWDAEKEALKMARDLSHLVNPPTVLWFKGYFDKVYAYGVAAGRAESERYIEELKERIKSLEWTINSMASRLKGGQKT